MTRGETLRSVFLGLTEPAAAEQDSVRAALPAQCRARLRQTLL